jgi:hypothetical protein
VVRQGCRSAPGCARSPHAIDRKTDCAARGLPVASKRNNVRNRNIQQEERHTSVLEGDRRGEAAPYTSARVRDQRRNPVKRLIPFVIMAVFGVIIARQEIPAVDAWWQKTFAPDQWRITETCRQAVLEDAKERRYVRALKIGKVHHTADGPYVDGLRIVVLGEGGADETIHYTCYLDNDGQLFRLTRIAE